MEKFSDFSELTMEDQVSISGGTDLADRSFWGKVGWAVGYTVGTFTNAVEKAVQLL